MAPMSNLDHVLWIGGHSGAGKSTVGRQLVRRWGLRLYACDTRTWEHRDRAIASGVDAALPRSPLVLAEGTLLPPHVADPARSVWLVPSKDFQARHRDDPERRTEPMEAVIAAANRRGIPIVVVDGSRPVAEIAVEVEVWLADALKAGPTATTIGERRAVLRGANLDVVRQIRMGCARSWATADPEVQVRTFTCECGDEACEADIDATVGAAASGPVIAPGHASSQPGVRRQRPAF